MQSSIDHWFIQWWNVNHYWFLRFGSDGTFPSDPTLGRGTRQGLHRSPLSPHTQLRQRPRLHFRNWRTSVFLQSKKKIFLVSTIPPHNLQILFCAIRDLWGLTRAILATPRQGVCVLSAGRSRGCTHCFPIFSRPHSEAGDCSVIYSIILYL